ncbi:cytochrome P450 6j1-like isoform X2 [Anthonomus grandis grandis]|nr:cytochrome P450 6j1-like isoform X2 [Anthonomus grandis grandis]XP_050299616.1 cytochrome P450 6j1-like isoform X2 [Anthonomus grandis grandis]XP_050299617.1 cytochrome P450 6j1-like isoform X2 [Anthonomus grandis grandis]XP_050299618.1 cytochrome P450 6j1-like isoform X2 [Anthonomus grandis grandis]
MDPASLLLRLSFFGLFLILLYLYATRNFNYWKKRNIKYVKPVPFIGNLGPMITLKKNIGFFLLDMCETLKSDVFGFFAFDTPFLVVTSPKLLKNILVKDFSIFNDRIVYSPNGHPILENVMFLAKGQSWKNVRSKSSPAFTSGKLKNMFLLILKECKLLTDYIDKFVDMPNVEAKEICAKYSTNVIARCAFAVEANSFESDDAEFRKIGSRLINMKLSTAIRQTICWFSPMIVKLFGISVFEGSSVTRLSAIFKEVLHTRMNSNENTSNDLIDVLLESKKKGSELSEDFMVGSAVQFFTAGFETVSSVLSFTLYELTVNPDIQQRLRKEILKHIDENGFTYESLNAMKYLDMCVSETLRKYPTLPFLDRVCNADYKLTDEITIEKGTKIFVPLFGLHYNKELFPNPYKYDPERFADKSVINADNMLYYMPFGEGPRICIGNRFGLMGVKTALVSILSKFDLVKSDKTPEHINFDPKGIVLQSTIGIPITFKHL